MNIIQALSVPIMFLNMFGGIAAGIWLIFLGKWAPIGIAVASAFVSHYAIGFAMLPGALLSAAAFNRLKKGTGILGHFILLCASVYTFAVLWYWSVFIFGVFASYVGPNGAGRIPLLIMAYAVATAPVGYLASKERESIATTIATFCTMLGCAIFMLLLMFGISPYMSSNIFIGIMALGVFAQLVVSIQLVTAMQIEEHYDNQREGL